jgi:hypothetical protein
VQLHLLSDFTPLCLLNLSFQAFYLIHLDNLNAGGQVPAGVKMDGASLLNLPFIFIKTHWKIFQ